MRAKGRPRTISQLIRVTPDPGFPTAFLTWTTVLRIGKPRRRVRGS
jgi:hypothetical protein